MNTYSEDKMYENYSSEVERMQKCIDELQQENKKLNGAIQTYDILLKANTEENKRLKDNWIKLKEHIGAEWYCFDNESVEFEVAKDILNKMQELEKSDNNE